MPIFHAKEGRGRITSLVLHDGKKEWVRAVDGVVELGEAAAKRFREIADQYGYHEVDAPQPAAAEEPVSPKESTADDGAAS